MFISQIIDSYFFFLQSEYLFSLNMYLFNLQVEVHMDDISGTKGEGSKSLQRNDFDIETVQHKGISASGATVSDLMKVI